jgi:GINS complex subunit 3
MNRDMIDLTMPRAYSPQVRNALQASPESVHLRNLGGGGGSFYAGGMRLLALYIFSSILPPSSSASTDALLRRSEDAELGRILENSFKTRLIPIMDQSQHSLADHGGEGAAYEFSQGLDSWEKERESCFSVLSSQCTAEPVCAQCSTLARLRRSK